MFKLAIDVMGGDYGIEHNIRAISKFVKYNKDAEIILVGDSGKISSLIRQNTRIEVVHAEQVITMDESPVDALRNKKKSSIHVGMELLKKQRAQALVSAGNTGAIVALSKFSIGMKPGIKRPVLAAEGIDCCGRKRLFLDLGANVDCSAKMLHQFAILGSEAFTKLHPENKNPRVGLFNVGSEQVKGSVIIKEAATLLNVDENINYIGFVEGDGIVDSAADVIVVDGFTGNITLKAIEGTIKCMLGKKSFLRDVLLLTLNKSVKKRIALMPGPAAILLGINLPIYKIHGSASQKLFYDALWLTYNSLKDNQ